MTTTRIKGPGVKVLDYKLKSVSEFEGFRHSLVFLLRQDLEYRPYLKSGVIWGIKTTPTSTRLLQDDAGRSQNPPTGQTKEEKCELVDFMLEQISMYCPLIPQQDIVHCESLDAVWKLIRIHNDIEPTGALLNAVWSITRQPNESPQALWSRLKQQYDDALLKRHTLKYVEAELDEDEVMSPTLHNVIILHWLQLIHPKMRDMVSQRFSRELRDATYASIWPEISRSIDSFLKDLTSESASICRYDSPQNYSSPRSSRLPWRGRGVPSRFRGTPTTRSQNKQCDYCRLTGRRSYDTHYIDDCFFLKKERPMASRAVDAGDEFDDHLAEFREVYDEDPVVDEASCKVHVINKVTTEDSPVLPLFKGKKSYPVTLDTGGTTTVMDGGTAEELECTLLPTSQRAFQADGVTELKVLGKTQFELTRKSKSFSIDALVCEMEPVILAGMPFMIDHDVGVRPAKNQIIIDGTDIVEYSSKRSLASKPPHSRRITSYTVRSPQKTVILPGEEIKFQLPKHMHDEDTVALEPRYDNNYQASLSKVWPVSKVYNVEGGCVSVSNDSADPIVMKKNQHVCNLQLQVADNDLSDSLALSDSLVASSDDGVSERMVRKTSTPILSVPKKVALYSSPVHLNPDGVLSPEQTAKFKRLLEKRDEVFNPKVSQYNQKSGQCYVEVNMGPVPPPQQKGKLPPFYGRDNVHELQEKIDELVEKGVLKRPQDIGVTVENLNTSFLVKKKDTTEKRFVTDFASIADYCRPSPSLMPDCDSTLRSIASWNYMIITDFTTAYYGLPLRKSSMKYTGIASPMKGVFVYTVGCMGLPGTEVALEELTSLLFGDMVMKGKVAKLADDLFVGGETIEELYENFEKVLEILTENNLKLKAKKTYIAPKSATILGWIWSAGSLQASSHKLCGLSECDPPGTVKGLKGWLGAYRHLSRVVKDYGVLLLPMEDMVAGKRVKDSPSNTKIVWSAEQLSAFKKAQAALKDAKTITLPQPEDTLHIVTDAAVHPSAIGATLYILRERKTLLGGFFNAKLPPFQRRWLPCELEGVAIGLSLLHFGPYILQSRHRPVVLTDSKACVDAVKKLARGEYSTSARLCTFLSTVSRYGATVKHIQGNVNIVSDYISRDPVPCTNQKCQMCSFIKESLNSVVAAVTVADIMEGKYQLPFTNKSAWVEIQSECRDLSNVMKYLRSGTTPGKKGRNLRIVKQYMSSKVVISTEGTLVVRQTEPFLPQTERIVVPQSVLHGILTVLHIITNHPSSYQLRKVFNRCFFALKLDPAASQVSDSCHQCSSLKDIPKSLQKESSDPPPSFISQKCAADVIKRNSQLVLVLRECVSSYTQSQLISRETAEEISEGLVVLANLIRPSDMTPMTIRVDPHSSHRSLFKNEGSLLVKHNIHLEIGREHNVNHNPVAEKAVRELIKEMLILQPNGGPISSTVLSEATANLNSRIRAPGVSAHEIFTQRDQNTGKQLTLDDVKLIEDQYRRRLSHHAASEKCKSGGRSVLPDANVSVGSIVYIYNDGSKLRARPRYVVLAVKDGWCKLRRFAEKQLGRITYSVKLSECYLVPDEIVESCLPPYPQEEDPDEVVIVNPIPPAVVQNDAIPDAESESDVEDPEEVVDDSEEETESFCKVCHRPVTEVQQGLLCDKCEEWSHRYCIKMKKPDYMKLTKRDDFQWTCPTCPPDPPDPQVDDQQQ